MTAAVVAAAGAMPASAAGFDVWKHSKMQVNKYVEEKITCEFLDGKTRHPDLMGLRGKTVDQAYTHMLSLEGNHSLWSYLERQMGDSHPAIPQTHKDATGAYLGARILQKAVNDCKVDYLKAATTGQVNKLESDADSNGAKIMKSTNKTADNTGTTDLSSRISEFFSSFSSGSS